MQNQRVITQNLGCLVSNIHTRHIIDDLAKIHFFIEKKEINEKKLRLCSLFLPNTLGLEEDAKQNEDDTDIEREIDFAALAEDKEGEEDGIAGFKIISQIDSKGREALQGLDLQEVHTNGTEQSVTEHEPEIRAFRHNDNRLLAREEKEVDRDDGRHSSETS